MGAALQTVVRDRSKRAPLRRRTLRIRPERPPCRACPAKVLSVSYCRFLLADWLMISLHTSSISQNLCRLCQLRLDLSSGSARKTGRGGRAPARERPYNDTILFIPVIIVGAFSRGCPAASALSWALPVCYFCHL